MKRLCGYVPEALFRRVKVIAAETDKTISEILVEVLKQYIKQYEEEKERKEVRT